MTAACPRPARGSDPGWPRPHLPCDSDLSANRWQQEYGDTPVHPIKATRPVPWMADQDAESWDPWGFDDARSSAAREEDLCQVCGGPRGDLVYFLVRASERANPSRLTCVEMYGAALCSVRCARLTAAVCPRYAEDGPVDVYAVPNDERVDIVGCGENNDEEADITGDGCVLVDTVGRTS